MRYLLAAALFALLVAFGTLVPRAARRMAGEAGQVTGIPVPGGDFELQSGSGPWRLSEQAKGKGLVLLYFGFTRCPDQCPTTLSNLARAIRELSPAQRQKVMVVFVSVDYRSDRPDQVAQYARSFGDDFVGVTGAQQAIDHVVRSFDATYAFTPVPGSAMGYTVDHTGYVYFLTPAGSVIDMVMPEHKGVDLRSMIEQHLRA
jgi:protein SCO1/2